MNIQHRIAVCSWSLHPDDPEQLIERLKAAGQSAVQLALGPVVNSVAWKDCGAEFANAHMGIVSGMVGCVGEDYSSIPAIRRTGGVMPDDTWPATLAAMRAAAPRANALGLNLVTFHAGFIPNDVNSPGFERGLQRVAAVADCFAEREITVAMETGQERAETLAAFLNRLNRPDVGVNFDPANMLLYGSGDPIEALRLLLPFVRQVHIKDAIASGVVDQWGKEVAAGRGQVDWPQFFSTLKIGGYPGNFVIEREAGEKREEDVRAAAELVATAFS